MNKDKRIIRVWFFSTGEKPVEYTYAYDHLHVLEKMIRGRCDDLIVVDGMSMSECPMELLDTFKLILVPKDGLMIFLEDMSSAI